MQFRALPKGLQAYIIAHFLALIPVLWAVSQQRLVTDWRLVGGLLLLTLAAGTWKLELTVFQGRFSMVFAIACLGLLLQGASAAILCAAAGALVTTFVRTPADPWGIRLQRQPVHRVLFNPVHCALACGISALASRATEQLLPPGPVATLCFLAVFTGCYFLCNSWGIALAIALQQKLRPVVVWRENFLPTAPGFFASALAAAAIWEAFRLAGAWAIVLVLPLYLVYYGYWVYLDRLRRTNASLKEQIVERERAERALEKEREFLHAILENAADAILACDAQGRICHANRAARELNPAYVPGAEALSPEGAASPVRLFPTTADPLQRALADQSFREVELSTGDSEGHKQLLVSGQPLYDPEGRKLGAVVALHDITARRQAEEEREQRICAQAARTAAEDAQRRIAFLAQASERLAASLEYEDTLLTVATLAVPLLADACVVDIPQEDGSTRRYCTLPAAGSGWGTELHSLATPELEPPIRASLSSGATVRGSGEDRLHGLQAPGLDRVSLPDGWGFVCLPICARSRVLGVVTLLIHDPARELPAADLELAEDLVRRAALAIENAGLYRAVQDDQRRKDLFLAMLGHELRNPLAAMRNALEVIRLRGTGEPSLQPLLDLLHRQTLHQSRLIDDLLDVARITQGKIELRKQTVSLCDCVRNVVESARAVVDGREQTLHVDLPDVPVWLQADPTRIEQVIANLLSNASKYTDAGGFISLRVELVTSGDAVLRVRDNGIGIRPDMLPRIFDVFTQVDESLDRAQGGLGLGLNLVRHLIELHGGRVEANSEGEHLGSEFVLFLPTGVPPALVERAPGAGDAAHPFVNGFENHAQALIDPVPVPASPPRVLVVDDNHDAASTVGEILDHWGYRVEIVHSGPAALEMVGRGDVQAALIDISMPGMDGYDVAQSLRSGEQCPGIVLIALTGYGQSQDVERSLAAGFNAHVTKPADLDRLRELLERNLPGSAYPTSGTAPSNLLQLA